MRHALAPPLLQPGARSSATFWPPPQAWTPRSAARTWRHRPRARPTSTPSTRRACFTPARSCCYENPYACERSRAPDASKLLRLRRPPPPTGARRRRRSRATPRRRRPRRKLTCTLPPLCALMAACMSWMAGQAGPGRGWGSACACRRQPSLPGSAGAAPGLPPGHAGFPPDCNAPACASANPDPVLPWRAGRRGLSTTALARPSACWRRRPA